MVAEYSVTALLSTFNALYFLAYPWRRRRHRIGAWVLGVVSLGVAVESFYFGVWVFLRETAARESGGSWALVGGAGLVGSLLIAGLVARRHLRW